MFCHSSLLRWTMGLLHKKSCKQHNMLDRCQHHQCVSTTRDKMPFCRGNHPRVLMHWLHACLHVAGAGRHMLIVQGNLRVFRVVHIRGNPCCRSCLDAKHIAIIIKDGLLHHPLVKGVLQPACWIMIQPAHANCHITNNARPWRFVLAPHL